MFVASIVKIKTIDNDVLDSEWALTSCALRLVGTCEKIRGKLELVAKVNRSLSAEILNFTECVKEVFEALERNNTPTLQLVVPSYYLLQRKLQPVRTESGPSNLFRSKLQRYLDEKFWTSITALHCMLPGPVV